MAKRLFDLAFAVVTLVLLSPILLVVALWIRLDSPGPVLFRQCRVGLGGREFEILKFRTMRIDAERLGPQITVGADTRITRSGQWLRKYKLDEFPQFVNVLKGEMSIVGPRPEVPRYVAMYPERVRHAVLSVRPGITDLASIEFRDENSILGASDDPELTYIEQVMPAKLKLCERYLRERSFVGDLRIILRTVFASFLPPN
jgi:lipopolysaccharide/colanic/teichoic acid biosynthesis glycosyltransferase